MATKAKAKTKAPVEKYVTIDKFNELQDSIASLVGFVKENIKSNADAKALVPDTPLEKEIKKAGHGLEPVNSEWDEIAHDIIGEALDHCEVKHLRNGGLIFTLVIKNEFSNAPDNYLAEMKEDRRSKEIGAEGIGGVENWCKLVKQNLARPKIKQSVN